VTTKPSQDRWTLILIAIIVFMGAEIIYLMIQNQKLRGIIEDPKKYFKTLSTDDIVPSFNALDIYGQNISLRYSPDAPFSLLFWFSPTCSACEDNIDFWNEMYTDTSIHNIRYLGMCSGSPDEVREFAGTNGIKYRVICADDPYLVETYKGNVLPQTVLISPDGMIIRVWPGALDNKHREEIINTISQLQP